MDFAHDLSIVIPGSVGNARISQHLDAEILHSYVRRAGFRASIVDGAAAGLDAKALNHSPCHTAAKIVYWHLPSRSHYRALSELCTHAEIEPMPGKLWIAGGHFAGHHDRELLERLPRLDAVVRGELEAPLESLLHAVRDTQPWQDCAGLTVRGSQGPVRNPLGAELPDLALLPAASDDLFHPGRREVGQEVLFNRGCNSDCLYCGYQTLYRESFAGRARFWRTRSPEAIADEIELYATKHGVSRFLFHAAVFFGYDSEGGEVIRRVAEEILCRGLDIRFKIVTHPHHMVRNRGLLPLLQRAGLDSVYLGIDFSSEAALQRYRVEFRRTDILQALHLLHTRRLSFTPGFIFYEPWMPQKNLREQLLFLRRIQPYFTHMKSTYPYFLDRHLLHTVLLINSFGPLAHLLKRDGLLAEPASLKQVPRARFRDRGVARFSRIHRSVYRRYLRTLQPLLWCPRCVNLYPQLNLLPVDLVEHLLDVFSSEGPLSEDEMFRRASDWLAARLAADLPDMIITANLDEEQRAAVGSLGLTP